MSGIRNSKGEYLISRRSPTRPTFPLLWECVGGAVIKGESSIEGALRETKEEIGIDLRPEDEKILGDIFFQEQYYYGKLYR